ncbi:MAG: MOSC domain-containing protein [Bryobacteraceae bacterium]|nr:MOSC domain-containing protein [Bryobacteraceae bacterium]
MTGVVVQVSVSPGGVPKRAVAEGFLTRAGFEEDACSHPGIHGGPNQAILLVTSEGIEELMEQGYALFPGALGENLTTKGLDRRQLRAGQRFRAGEAIIELTRLRGPCNALDIYGPGIQQAIFDKQTGKGEVSSPRWALSGFYGAVVQPGFVRPGDAITLLEQAA